MRLTSFTDMHLLFYSWRRDENQWLDKVATDCKTFPYLLLHINEFWVFNQNYLSHLILDPLSNDRLKVTVFQHLDMHKPICTTLHRVRSTFWNVFFILENVPCWLRLELKLLKCIKVISSGNANIWNIITIAFRIP